MEQRWDEKTRDNPKMNQIWTLERLVCRVNVEGAKNSIYIQILKV